MNGKILVRGHEAERHQDEIHREYVGSARRQRNGRWLLVRHARCGQYAQSDDDIEDGYPPEWYAELSGVLVSGQMASAINERKAKKDHYYDLRRGPIAAAIEMGATHATADELAEARAEWARAHAEVLRLAAVEGLDVSWLKDPTKNKPAVSEV